VFIIGHLRGRSTRPVFPIQEIHQDHIEGNGAGSWGQVGVTLSGRSAGGENARGNYIMTPRDASTALDANYWKGPDKHDARTVIFDYLNRIIREDEIFNTLKTNQGSPSSATTLAVLTDNLGGNIKDRVRPSNQTPAWCLGGSETQILESARIRHLTPVECERLQGFPDGWTEGISDTQRYKCLGNAVTVNVIRFLGDRIKESINSKSKRIET